jgi:diguanylate cyclase (GGDEF)-like protein/PAS domain S-box-containing protein
MIWDKSFYRGLVDHGAAGLMVLDQAGYVRYANPSAIGVLGGDPTGTAFSKRFRELSSDLSAAFVEELSRRKVETGPMYFVGDATRADGTALRLEVRGVNALRVEGVDGIVLTVIDVSAQYQREKDLVAAATLDSLTRLPNRNVFLDRLQYARRTARRTGVGGTVAYVDIDQLKSVNYCYGRSAGDVFLCAIAQRLVESLRDLDTVARLDGDEFGLFLPNTSLSGAQSILERTRVSVARPIMIGAQTLPAPTLSVGIATLDEQGEEMTLRDCDMALYAAKERGRNQVVAFGDDVRRVIERRRELATTVIELSEQNDRLHIEARTDALTGLRNRRALAEIEEKVPGGANCPWTTAAVLFFDLDNFSDYNKRYNDSAGDAALREVAKALRQVGRHTDLVFRKGGEEFVIVLPDVDLPSAVTTAERTRSVIQALGILHTGAAEGGVVTITVGVSCGRTGQSIGERLSDASGLAMDGKLNGQRNRVHFRQ